MKMEKFSNPHKSHLAITTQAGNAKNKQPRERNMAETRPFLRLPSLLARTITMNIISDHSPGIFFYDKSLILNVVLFAMGGDKKCADGVLSTPFPLLVYVR